MPADREDGDLDSARLAPTPQLVREQLGDPLADPMRDPLDEQPRVRLEGDIAGEVRRTTLPPPRERDDELMDNPPVGDYHRGRLGGHAQGKRMRLVFAIVAVTLVAGAVGLVVWFVRNRPAEHASQYELPAGTDLEGRPRVMSWTGGKGRFGLDRKPPGVLEIALPDRTLRLADGSDQAQMVLEVEDGKTTAIKVLFGEVVEELAPGAKPVLSAK